MDAAEEIAETYGLGRATALDGPVARGHQGEVWRLTTDRGRWAVKRTFVALEEAAVVPGVTFQEAAEAAGVATPRPARTGGGAVLADVALGRVRVDAWAELADPDPGLDAAEVGAAVAAVHRVVLRTEEPLDPWFAEPVPADRWAQLVDDLVAVGAPFTEVVRQASGELHELAGHVEPPSPVQVCHRDLFADNVRRGEDGRVWIIDWQDCGTGDPSHELALVLFEFARGDPGRAAALHAAYVAAGGPGRVDGPGAFGTLVAQLGHILEISCRRWLASTASAAVRATNEGRVAEFADGNLTLDLAERLVAAVRR